MSLKPPRFLYRYFDTREHALKFIEGVALISTIAHCRRADALRQHDPEEGTLTWQVNVKQSQEPERFRRVAANLAGVEILSLENCAEVELDTNIVTSINDAYILCFSKSPKLQRYFGGYCVRIAEPVSCYQAITRELSNYMHIGSSRFAPMKYQPRLEIGDGPKLLSAEDHAFIGPPGNSIEEECRMIWVPSEVRPLDRFELHVPALRRFCSLLTK